MIGYISCLISFALCTFVYIRMLRREEPGTLGKKSAVPVVLGFIAPIISTVLVTLRWFGPTIGGHPKIATNSEGFLRFCGCILKSGDGFVALEMYQ